MTPVDSRYDMEASAASKSKIRVLGIDLGTTNSTIAEARLDAGSEAPAAVRCIEVEQPTQEGVYTHVLFPSLVAIHEGRVWVGEGAKRLRSRAPELGLEQNKNLFFDCKNEIGIAKTYHRAPEGFRSAAQIGAKVLASLMKAALDDDPQPPGRVVVTVPASFQAAQRRDTLEAARLAGLELSSGDLLDEPVAALLDYLMGEDEDGERQTTVTWGDSSAASRSQNDSKKLGHAPHDRKELGHPPLESLPRVRGRLGGGSAGQPVGPHPGPLPHAGEGAGPGRGIDNEGRAIDNEGRGIGNGGTLVVLDFGGGTCDVAVMKVARAADGALQVAPLAVSRYHRLGGGDIDAAIVHEVLIPQLVKENGLGPFDLAFEDKKKVLEPSLLGLAEALKISLCTEVARLVQFGKYDGADRAVVAAQQPVTQQIRLGDRTLKLSRPRLSAEQFETLLAPFLDRDMLYARETEYRLTCSVFAPLQDALDRSELEAGEVDAFLMVGGSSLIPQVVQAVRPFFPNAAVLTYADRDSLQTAVARGAALHALSLARTGRGLVHPVANDTISLRTESRLVELIPKGAELPYPPEGWARRDGLTVPVTSPKRPVDIRVELVAGEDGGERPLFRGRWAVPGPVTKGEGLVLEYRYDANQVLELRLRLATQAGTGAYTCAVENPCTHVVNPREARVKLEALEEELRTGKVPGEQMPGKLVEAAELMAELGHRERAFAQLKKVLQSRNAPDGAILNRMAMLAAEFGDAARAEKLYRESAAVEPSWSGPLFNLALLLERRGDPRGAVEEVDEAIKREPLAPCLALRARLRRALGEAQAAERDLAAALEAFGQPHRISEWELGWLFAAAGMAGKAELQEKARAELKLRRRGADTNDVGGVLPGLRHLELVRK